jgi:hypothetical protein
MERLKMQNCIEQDDVRTNIHSIERAIQPVSTDLVKAELAGRFRELRAQFETHIKSVAEVEEGLRDFYGSHGLKVAKSRMKRGSRSEGPSNLRTTRAGDFTGAPK